MITESGPYIAAAAVAVFVVVCVVAVLVGNWLDRAQR